MMMALLNYVLVFFIGIISSFIGAIVGGGGLISIPFLMFLGLPPQVAIATNKLGAIGMDIGTIPKFYKEKKIVLGLVIPFSLIGLAGAYIGANMLLTVDEKILSTVVGLLILSLLPLIVFQKRLGVRRKEVSRARKISGYVGFFFIMVYAGFFGGGAGTLLIYLLIFSFGLTFIRSNATISIPWFAQSILALVVFALHGIVNYAYGVFLLLGMAIGGYWGAHTAIKKGNVWVRYVFCIVVVASVIKLFFFS
jgi:uncharacterized membrane protein YfcA